MFYFQLKKKQTNHDRDFSIISVGQERAIKQVFFLGLIGCEWHPHIPSPMFVHLEKGSKVGELSFWRFA